MIAGASFTPARSAPHHLRMGPTLPPVIDRSARATVADDVWSESTTTTLPRERADRFLQDEKPPIERPPATSLRRLATVVSTVTVLAIALAFPALGNTDSFSDETTRLLSTALVVGHLVSIASFAWWSFAQRRTIDALRWRSFRRPTRSWRWALGWGATPIVAVAVGLAVSSETPNRMWLIVALGVALVTICTMLLQALGTNMARVVLGAKRWLLPWGLVTGLVDALVVDVAVTGVFDTRVEPGRLDDLVAWLLPLLVLQAFFVIAYMKRVERWVLEWWDQRYGISDEEVVAVLQSIEPSDRPERRVRRRLIPTLFLRLAVFGSYLATAGTSLWVAGDVWAGRDDLTPASDIEAAVDRIGPSAVAFVASICAVQIAQALWSMVAAWNARRCTIAAPSVIRMLGLFLAGPAVLAYGIRSTEETGDRLTFVGIALLLNLACWAMSFSVIAKTLHRLGRSSDLVARWGVTVLMHGVVIFMFRPLDRLDGDVVFAGVVVGVALVEAAIFAIASVAAWRAMQHFDTATAEYRQVRRVRI